MSTRITAGVEERILVEGDDRPVEDAGIGSVASGRRQRPERSSRTRARGSTTDDAATRRRRQLARLRDDVGRLRADLAKVSSEIRRLAEAEAARPLTPDERRQAVAVRWENERLRYELQVLRESFLQLQDTRHAADRPNARLHA